MAKHPKWSVLISYKQRLQRFKFHIWVKNRVMIWYKAHCHKIKLSFINCHKENDVKNTGFCELSVLVPEVLSLRVFDQIGTYFGPLYVRKFILKTSKNHSILQKRKKIKISFNCGHSNWILFLLLNGFVFYK